MTPFGCAPAKTASTLFGRRRSQVSMCVTSSPSGSWTTGVTVDERTKALIG